MTTPLDVLGPAAPPRSNGELVFDHPWESRAFGMAVTLHEAGLFSWPEFQAALIRRISDWQEQSAPRQPWSYYEHWLDALTEVLAATGHLPSEMVHARAHLLAARPAGDDHAH